MRKDETTQPGRRPRWQAIAWAVPALLLGWAAPFLAAGSLRWPMAWVYLALTVLGTAASRIAMARAHPELVAERARFTDNAGTKGWDRVIALLVSTVGPIGIGLVAGLDRRFGWPPAVAPALQGAGLLAVLLAYGLSTWAMVANRFFSSVVRIQSERGHHAVDSGPYRFVRHPAYASVLPAELGIALMLGSVWALIPAALNVGLFVVRTALEDRTLHAELPGYQEYAARVRYRLLPGIW